MGVYTKDIKAELAVAKKTLKAVTSDEAKRNAGNVVDQIQNAIDKAEAMAASRKRKK